MEQAESVTYATGDGRTLRLEYVERRWVSTYSDGSTHVEDTIGAWMQYARTVHGWPLTVVAVD